MQPAEVSRLHQEGGFAPVLQGGDHVLAMTIAPGAFDLVQGYPVPEQHRAGRVGAWDPMGQVAPAVPEVGEGHGQALGGSHQRMRRGWRGLA